MRNLVAAIVADKTVDTAEVKTLSNFIYDDGVVTIDEVRSVFEINDACDVFSEEFSPLMIKVALDWAAEDGVIDEEEGNIFMELIGNDVDDNEAAVLTALSVADVTIEHEGLRNLIENVAV